MLKIYNNIYALFIKNKMNKFNNFFNRNLKQGSCFLTNHYIEYIFQDLLWCCCNRHLFYTGVNFRVENNLYCCCTYHENDVNDENADDCVGDLCCEIQWCAGCFSSMFLWVNILIFKYIFIIPLYLFYLFLCKWPFYYCSEINTNSNFFKCVFNDMDLYMCACVYNICRYENDSCKIYIKCPLCCTWGQCDYYEKCNCNFENNYCNICCLCYICILCNNYTNFNEDFDLNYC